MVKHRIVSDDIDIIDFSECFYIEYWKSLRVIWSRWHSLPSPCFSPELIDDMLNAFSFFTDDLSDYTDSFRYMVLQSEMKGVFSMGGDLNHFYRLIIERDYAGMTTYAKKSHQLIQALIQGLQRRVTTFALISGKCFGGGFEVALSCDYRIAERNATFSFPEILLGIFPGMGGVSLLARLTNKQIFEEVLYSGKTFSADELLAFGLIDEVVDEGAGCNAVEARLKRLDSAHSAFTNMLSVRKNTLSIEAIEFQRVIEEWVECVMNLDKRRLLILKQIALKQNI